MHARLQWIWEGDEGYISFINLKKKKVVSHRILDLRHVDGSLKETPAKS